MSSDKRYIRKNPEEVVRREPSEPPRESFIRAKGGEGVDSALDTFLRTQNRRLLAEFSAEIITDALTHRLLTHDPKTLVPFAEWMKEPVLLGFEADIVGLQRASIEFSGLSPRPEYVEPLLTLALDASESLRSQARDTLLGYDELLPSGCVWLRELLVSPGTSQQRRRRGMELLALFGDPQALTPLIDFLGDSDRSLARRAHQALRTLTCHDLGTMRSAWQRWADKSQTRSRVDWLIEALADRRPDLRESALIALTRITGQSFNIKPGDSRESYLVAQEQFAALKLHSPSLIRGVSITPPSPWESDKEPH